MVKQTIVLYPCPPIGHLVSMVELGKLILKHHPTFSITILLTPPPYNTTNSTSSYINHVSQTTPSIHFHHLPTISLPPDYSLNKETITFELLQLKLLELNNSNVRQALQTISQTSTIRFLIMDVFCCSSSEVIKLLNIPIFYFYTSGISALALFLYCPTLNHIDLNTHVDCPGLPSISTFDLPKMMIDHDKSYEFILNCATHLPKSEGLIVNSFESLEPRGFKAISNGLCVPNAPTPPLYCIGPLIAGHNRCNGSSGVNQCLSWLDLQPSRSVVFLCFGSMGSFSETQLKEIAMGLENSEQRFLWVVRNPPNEDETKRILAPSEPDLHALLPNRFMNRTKCRGLVVKSWAPQVEVLNHDSVGGFVTHCGWNSVLESVCAGVPMVAWPLYAEQRLNRVFLVEELKLAFPMNESKDGFVSASEVEKRVRQLMDSEEGKVLRERVLVASQDAKAAMSEGGSSLRALSELAESWM